MPTSPTDIDSRSLIVVSLKIRRSVNVGPRRSPILLPKLMYSKLVFYIIIVEIGCFGAARVERQQRLCQRCEGSSVDDVEHMIFNCSSLEAERQKHQSLFARGRVD